jgi:transposase-like protein
MDAFGMKGLAEKVGRDLVTIYRWRRALGEGHGISDTNKRALIAATAGTEHAIEFLDFFPRNPEPEAAAR